MTGFGLTSYFLYNTVDGFSEKYVTTTVETKSIKEYPFPAVTFHPGDYNSKTAFLKTFLNQLEFTRYNDSSPLRDNEKFVNLYNWLISSMNDKMFEDTERLLSGLGDKSALTDGSFTDFDLSLFKAVISDFKDEICSLVALRSKNISIKSDIRSIFMSNMYKYRTQVELYSVIQKQVRPVIQEAVTEQRLTKTEIIEACKDPQNEPIKREMEVALASYIYISYDSYDVDVGAGDIATGPYNPQLTHDTHTMVTKMYNEMVIN